MHGGRRLLIAGSAVTLVALSVLTTMGGRHAPSRAAADSTGIHKIKHVVVVMQENRSFDSYFGTYPGADGIPRNAAGKPTACVPNPKTARCVRSYHDTRDKNAEAPHDANSAQVDIAGGLMNGFVIAAEVARAKSHAACPSGDTNPSCVSNPRQVMGYHNRHELPLYWGYADNYVLQDHMFEPTLGWSLPSHLFMVS